MTPCPIRLKVDTQLMAQEIKTMGVEKKVDENGVEDYQLGEELSLRQLWVTLHQKVTGIVERNKTSLTYPIDERINEAEILESLMDGILFYHDIIDLPDDISNEGDTNGQE